MKTTYRFLRKVVSRPVNFIVSPAEKLCLRSIDYSSEIRHKPIFIVAVPRTGTTLVLQILLNSFDMGCLTNLMGWFYRAPYLTGIISNKIIKAGKTNFESKWGKIRGLGAPNEGTLMWLRWFTGNLAINLIGGIEGKKAKEIRKSIIAITNLYNKPLVLKNHPYRIISLSKIMPEALFIVVSRNVIQTSNSILYSRITQYGSKEVWWGPGLQDREVMLKPYWEQVVDQVVKLQKSIEESRKQVGEEKFHTIRYEDICKNPMSEIEEVNLFLYRNGCMPFFKRFEIKPFTASTRIAISDSDFNAIRNYAYNEYGIE